MTVRATRARSTASETNGRVPRAALRMNHRGRRRTAVSPANAGMQNTLSTISPA